MTAAKFCSDSSSKYRITTCEFSIEYKIMIEKILSEMCFWITPLNKTWAVQEGQNVGWHSKTDLRQGLLSQFPLFHYFPGLSELSKWLLPFESHHLVSDCVQSLRLSDAYMRQLTRPPLVQIMACRLIGPKPLFYPMLEYCWFEP